MDSKDIEPFFMDLRYLEPISDVIRFEDARFKGLIVVENAFTSFFIFS
ncbi:hypothetical protein Hanom_Chr06g00517821 [Helianthus anomalus]